MSCVGYEYEQHQASLDQVPLEQFGWALDGPRAQSNGQQAPATGQKPSVTGEQIPADGQQPSLHGSSAERQQETVKGPQPSSEGSALPPPGQMQHLQKLQTKLKEHLPAPLAQRLWCTALICCVSQAKATLDSTLGLVSRVLDQAEALQAQIITDTWCVKFLFVALHS